MLKLTPRLARLEQRIAELEAKPRLIPLNAYITSTPSGNCILHVAAWVTPVAQGTNE